MQEYSDCFGPELIFSTNENISCHSARVTSLGSYKKARKHSFTLFHAGQTSQHDRAHILSLHFLAAGRTSEHERAHSLFFTDSLSHISSSSLSTMSRPHPIYGLLVSGESFFHHSSFLLNQQILGETNWIFSTPALTSAF